jgi:hypothetical protein
MAIGLNAAGEPVGVNLPEHLTFDAAIGNPLDQHTQAELDQMTVRWGEGAERSFNTSIAELNSLVRKYASVTLLSHFAYFDTAFYENYGAASEYSPVEQHNVEILQALILAVPQNEFQGVYPDGLARTKINSLLKEAGLGFAFKRMGTDQNLSAIVRELARTGTQTVRNPGTQGQILQNLKELFASLDSLLQQRKEVTFSGLYAVCQGFMKQILFRINSHRKVMQECFKEATREALIATFARKFALSETDLAYVSGEYLTLCKTLEEIKAALFHYSERVFPRMFSADLEELLSMYPGAVDREALKQALSVWTMKFGDLSTSNVEHLFLANPVWVKPLIELKEGLYFWPVFPSFISFGMEMLEAQMGTDEGLKQA